MTGEADPERAALAPLKAGARMVVITLEALDGAILRGELRLDVSGVSASVISRIARGRRFYRRAAGSIGDVGVLPGGGRGVAGRSDGGGGEGVRAMGRP